MTDTRAAFTVIFGIVILSSSLLIILAPENLAEYTVIDTAFHKTDHRLIGRTAYNFNNASDIAEFPRRIDGWNGIDFRYPERIYEILDADIILSRSYSKEGNFILIDIINSDKRKSFHDPRICYGSKYNIVNESVEEIKINSSSIAFDRMYVNRIDLESKKNSSEKMVVLFWFMFRGGEAVTMLRLSSPVESDYETTYSLMENFSKTLMSVVYEEVKKPRSMGEVWIHEYGVLGHILIVILLAIPSALIVWGARSLKNPASNN